MNTSEDIIRALRRVRVPAQPGEYDIHGAIAEALAAAEIAFIHEYPLGPRRRVDFLCGKIAIEVKKGRPQPAALIRQLTGYLESGAVDEIIVVTQKRVTIPETIRGKRVQAVSLNANWGLALP